MAKISWKERESGLLSDRESTGEVLSSSGDPDYCWVTQKHAQREGGEKLELL